MTSFDRSAGIASVLMTLVVAALASPAELHGQGRDAIPTFLAIPETYPDVEGPAVVLREPGRDIVLLRRSAAGPEALSVALGLLRRLSERTPLRPGLAQMAPVTGFHLRTPLSAARQDRLEEILARLESRPVTHLGTLGLGRVVPLRDLDRDD